MSSPSWADPEEDATDEALFFLADQIAYDEGVDIDYAYRLAQLRYRTITLLADRRGE